MITIERITNATHGKSPINEVFGLNPELQDPMKQPEMPAAPTIPDNDAEIASIQPNSLRGKLADIQGTLRRTSAYSSAFQNYRQLLAVLMEKRGQIKEEIKELVRLKNRKRDKQAQQEAVLEKIEVFKKQINDLVNKAQFDGNKIFTAAGQDMAISVGNDVVINIPAMDFGVGPTDLDLSENPDTLFKKIRNQIQAILDYDGFLLGVEEKLQSARTLMAFELQDILEVEEHMARTNMTLELAKFSLARVLQDARLALASQAHVTAAAAVALLINAN